MASTCNSLHVEARLQSQSITTLHAYIVSYLRQTMHGDSEWISWLILNCLTHVQHDVSSFDLSVICVFLSEQLAMAYMYIAAQSVLGNEMTIIYVMMWIKFTLLISNFAPFFCFRIVIFQFLYQRFFFIRRFIAPSPLWNCAIFTEVS